MGAQARALPGWQKKERKKESQWLVSKEETRVRSKEETEGGDGGDAAAAAAAGAGRARGQAI